MPRLLKNETAYAKYIAAMQTAVMTGMCSRPNMNKSQAIRFRQMCYQIRQMYRAKHHGVSPWENVTININPQTWEVLLVDDKVGNLMYDAEGNVVDVERMIADVEIATAPQTELIYVTEEDVEYEKTLAASRGQEFKMPPNVRVLKKDPTNDEVLGSLGE